MNMRRTEELFESLAQLPDRLADQEAAVRAAQAARLEVSEMLEAAEAELTQSAVGANAELRKANVQLRKRSDTRYCRAAAAMRQTDETLGMAQSEQRRLENQFKAVCYMAQLQAAVLSMPGLKLPSSNGNVSEETLTAVGL